MRPVLFSAYGGDAERVHQATLRAIATAGRLPPARAGLAALCARHRTPVTVAGIEFPGVVGLAAGMDKNGIAVRSWGALGFGHVELGTVTAYAQPGNDRPRLFRLPQSRALVNRMGFNNRGAAALAVRLRAAGVARGNRRVGIPVGVSIGKTKVTPLAEATRDYLTSLRLLAPYADYLAVNVSSPNTPGLRSLQDADTLAELVGALVTEAGPDLPIFVKLAPDLTEGALEQALEVSVSAGAAGLIATNTTLGRDGLHPEDHERGQEAGGLSGAPLTVRARAVVGFLAARTTLPVIGVGGILTRDDGQAMLDAGARLLQIYTGYVYGGPGLVAELNRLDAREDDDDQPPTEPGSARRSPSEGRCASASTRIPACWRPGASPGPPPAWSAAPAAWWMRSGRRSRCSSRSRPSSSRTGRPASPSWSARWPISPPPAPCPCWTSSAVTSARSMDAYAAAYLADGAPLAADAITVSPYLGFGSLAGAIELALQYGRGVYVLALTSNPEGPQFQHARVPDGRIVGQVVVEEAARRNPAGRLGLGRRGGRRHHRADRCRLLQAQRLHPGAGSGGPGRDA